MNDKLKKQRSFLGKLAIFDEILQTYADIFNLYLCIFWPRLVLCHLRKGFGKGMMIKLSHDSHFL